MDREAGADPTPIRAQSRLAGGGGGSPMIIYYEDEQQQLAERVAKEYEKLRRAFEPHLVHQ